MTYVFASPGDDYLKKIGIMAYAVSSIEWTVLGDLHQHRSCLPTDCTVEKLAGKTTGRLGAYFSENASKVTDPAVANFLSEAGRVLSAAAEIRNAVLHARPATNDDKQRLYRWIANTQPFWIEDAWLDDKLQELATLERDISNARVT